MPPLAFSGAEPGLHLVTLPCCLSTSKTPPPAAQPASPLPIFGSFALPPA